jgi:predicted signal transduction protein with EAL and GGDEF domain
MPRIVQYGSDNTLTLSEISNSAKPRVLCVDDDSNILCALRATLRREWDVTTALSAAAGITAIDTYGPFAVVVSDLQMPGVDGIEFLRWVAIRTPDTSGILLTGAANLASAIAAVNAGYVFRFLTKPCPPKELIDAIDAGYRRYVAQCAQRVLLSHAVDQDALTGLPDRRRFAIDVARLQERHRGMPLSLIVVAIDDLDLVRGTLGHTAADHFFVAAAGRLQAAIRDPRHPLQHAVLFRVDNKFALLWSEQSQSPPVPVAEHLLKALEVEVSVAGQRLRLSGHAGIASIGAEPGAASGDALTALQNAEVACLEAKTSGHSHIGHFSVSAHDRVQRRMHILQRMRNPQFLADLSVVFQPQWDLARNSMSGLEALVRWNDPEFGSISPAEFVPLAEEEPDIADRLGEWVLLAACQQRQSWRSLIPDEVRVGINISATQLRTGELPERIMKCLEGTELPPGLVEVEITESTAIADFAKSELQLRELRRQGVHIAIDDFGVGFSSLSYLAELPAHTLKIDRAFIHGIEGGGNRTNLLRGICSLGHAMNMQVVVEGVESLSTATWLSTVGCDIVQGFGIARPLTIKTFSRWYRSDRPAIAAALRDSAAASTRCTVA